MALIEVTTMALAWFSLVWFASAAFMLILMQALLPRAWEQIRAAPPHGPDWAYNLWYRRERTYASLLALSFMLGLVAAFLFLLFG